MKKTVIIILTAVLVICSMILSKYYENNDKKNEINQFNVKYEKYKDSEITGRDIATIINQAVNDNEQAYIQKDKSGIYIQNDTNSISIEIQITDFAKERKYKMETLYGGGIAEFVKYYGDILFKYAEINYNSHGRVKYILFEQIKNK